MTTPDDTGAVPGAISGDEEPRVRRGEEVVVAAVREDVPLDQMTSFFDRAFHQVMEAVSRQGLAPVSAPVGIYFGMPDTTADIAAGFPVDPSFTDEAPVHRIVLPAARIAEIVHVGSYDTLSTTYERLAAWMEEQNLSPRELMWETYETEPTPEADPSSMRTRITWLVAD